jgi:hypothetical protein
MGDEAEAQARQPLVLNFRITDAIMGMATHNAINPARCYFWIHKEESLEPDCPGPHIFATTGSTIQVTITNELDDNAELALRPDMFVDVEISLQLPPAVILSPDAVVDTGRARTVFADAGDGYFEPRMVETGHRFGGRVEILRGIMPGERIVVSGNFLVDSESRMKVAAIRVTSGPAMIRNEGGLLTGYVYVDITGRDPGGCVAEADRMLREKVRMPPGTAFSWSGQYEAMQRVAERLKVVVPLTLFLIILLLYLNTRSAVKTMIVLLAVPFSAIGAVWLLYLLDCNLSVGGPGGPHPRHVVHRRRRRRHEAHRSPRDRRHLHLFPAGAPRLPRDFRDVEMAFRSESGSGRDMSIPRVSGRSPVLRPVTT